MHQYFTRQIQKFGNFFKELGHSCNLNTVNSYGSVDITGTNSLWSYEVDGTEWDILYTCLVDLTHFIYIFHASVVSYRY